MKLEKKGANIMSTELKKRPQYKAVKHSRVVLLTSLLCTIALASYASATLPLPLVHSMDNLDGLTATTPDTFLFLDPADPAQGSGSVRMEWNTQVTQRGAFKWELPLDPDASDWRIKLYIKPLSQYNITEVSFELLDAASQIAEAWYWDVPGTVPEDQWTRLTVDVGSQSGADNWVQPGGDITQVTALEFDEWSDNTDLGTNNWDYVIITNQPACNGPYYFSVDLGSDLDLSDSVTPGNHQLDCGDIYVENPLGGAPTLMKDDDAPTLVAAGHPFLLGGAPQPQPAQIGTSPVSMYNNFFDRDAEDQLDLEIFQPPTSLINVTPQLGCGLYIEPQVIKFSYDDDGPPGWAVSGDIPTTAGPDHGTAAAMDEIMIDKGPFGAWSTQPPPVTGQRDEVMMGLGPNPLPRQFDDDVDALDEDLCRFSYWSADHEANMGLDPGDIYVTDLFIPGQNRWLALDDVMNIGVPDPTDVDAWEFCVITRATYIQHFTVDPLMPLVLVGLFSVDQDDPDTPGVDESGGLIPSTIYMSNLIGTSVALHNYAEDVDALTVPEPLTLGVLLVGSLALMMRRRA
jgi:hypothetical protein